MKKRRIFAALLSLVMTITSLPVNAAGNDGNCGVSDQAAVTCDAETESAIEDEVCADEEYTLVESEIIAETEGLSTGGASKTYEFKYGQTEARKMLDRINSFRKSDDAWYWDKDNTTKVKASNLQDLNYDYGLEKIAMTRAIEIVHKWSHTRPNGGDCFTAWSELGYDATGYRGENIAYGYSTEESVFIGWREDDDKYDGQGHRRNMLSSNFKYIGIGHVIYNGTHYWVQDFGSVPTGEAKCDAADSEYKAVFDDDGNVTITKADGSTEPEEPDPEVKTFEDIVLVTKEKYDLAAKISQVLGNVTISKYKSDAKSIASVSKKGMISGKYNKAGSDSTYITAYSKNASGMQVAVAKIKVTVYKPVFKFSGTELTHPGMTISANGFLSNVPEGKCLRFSVPASKTEIMTVNESSGVITAGDKNGSVKVSVLIGEGDNAAKYTATLKLKKPKLKEEIHIKAGKTKKLTLKNVSGFNLDKISWKADGGPVIMTSTDKGNAVKLSADVSCEATVTATLNGAEYKTKVYVE